MPNLHAPPQEYLGEVPLADIQPSPHNPRKAFDAAGIAELAASIREHGLLQRILVRPRPTDANVGYSVMDGKWEGVSHFEIVAGHRRFAALQQLGVVKAAVVVRSIPDDTEALCIQAVENDQRADITPLERAAHYQRMRDAGMTVEAIAAGVGQSKTVVRSVLLLNKATPEVAGAIQAGALLPSVAEMVLREKDEAARAKALKKVLPRDGDDGEPVSVRRARTILERAKLPKDGAKQQGHKHDLSDDRHHEEADLCPACVKLLERWGVDLSAVPNWGRACEFTIMVNGRQVNVKYAPAKGVEADHLEYRCPKDLGLSETGYRSHFTRWPRPENVSLMDFAGQEAVRIIEEGKPKSRKAKAPASAARKTKGKTSPELDNVLNQLIPKPAPVSESASAITRSTPLADLLHNKDAPAASRALDAAGLGTVGELIDAATKTLKPGHSVTSAVYAHLRGLKGLGNGTVNEIGDALVDAGLVGGVGGDS